MTEEEFWKSWFAFWIVGGGPLLLGVISIGYTLYLSRCHLDAMKDALKNSQNRRNGDVVEDVYPNWGCKRC